MIPVDMSLSDPAQAPLQGVSLNAVVEQYLPGRTRLVFLDACRDNPLLASAGRRVHEGPGADQRLRGHAHRLRDEGRAGGRARRRQGHTLPFTAAPLLSTWANPDDIAVVLRTVRAKVTQRTGNRQQPVGVRLADGRGAGAVGDRAEALRGVRDAANNSGND
jgi:hypothetical protein